MPRWRRGARARRLGRRAGGVLEPCSTVGSCPKRSKGSALAALVARPRRRGVRLARACLSAVSRPRRSLRGGAHRGVARVGLLGVPRRERGRQRLAAARRRAARGQPATAPSARGSSCAKGRCALFEEGDPDRAHALASRRHPRRARGRQHRSGDARTRGAGAGAGRCRARSPKGMRALDEVNAAVVAGEMHDFVAIGLACCYMIAACDHVRDYDRAVQWCTRLKAFCAKWGLRPLFAVCRTQYASICMWRGTWLEAEQELSAAADELEASPPGDDGRRARAARRNCAGDRAGWSRRRRCSIRRSRIRWRSLGRAELAFDRGDARAAADLAERYLRRLPPQNRTDRAAGARAAGARARGAPAISMRARTALAELTAIAAIVATLPLRAAASLRRLDGRASATARSDDGAAALRGRGRSFPAERRAVRARARAHRAGARARRARPHRRGRPTRRSARSICSPS